MHWWQSAFPSTSKSQSHDDSVIPSGNGKHGFFSSRRHRLLTRAKKLLQPIDVGSPAHCNKHSARPQVTSPGAAASPLPLPELQRDHEPARSSSGVPLPSPNDINMRKECGEREKDMRNAEIMDGRDVDRRQIVGVGQGSIQKRENKAKRHTKTASLESYINIASSAPSTPFSMSPVRDIAPPAFFQVPDQHQPQPPTESHVGGCSCHTHTISLDNSPIHSPKLLVPPTSSPRLRETNALHPLPLPPLSPTRPASRPDLSGAALHLLSPTPISPSPAPAPIKSKWQKGKLIGRGTFGSVYVASNRETGALCAMKEVEILPDDSKSAECIRQLEQEITLLSRLKHRNIVQYYGSEVVGDKFYIYLEYVHPGSINKFIHDHCGAITESVVRNFTRHILFGLAYLHSQKTIHRDIKGANLLVDAYGVVKLADFGMAKHLNGQTAYLSLKGSPYWMAPELLQSSMQTDATTDIALAVDIWSLGCTIIEMMNGKPPWSEYEGPAALFKVLKETPPIPETMSAEGKDFLQCCFRRNPADRPAASRLLDHPFVNYSNEPDEIKESTQFLRDKPADQVPMNKNWMLSNNFSFSMCDSFTPVRISDGAISKHPI